MVKCLVKIKTKVSVHLRLINHCCREVRVRVLALGPRLLARALGALPLLPALPAPDVRHAPGEAAGLGVRGGSHSHSPRGARDAGQDVGSAWCLLRWDVITTHPQQPQFWGWSRLSPGFPAVGAGPTEQGGGRSGWAGGSASR